MSNDASPGKQLYDESSSGDFEKKKKKKRRDDDDDDESTNTNDGIGRSLTKRLRLATDGHVRLALPGNHRSEVDKRPISDVAYGFIFAFATLLILGVVDVVIDVNFQQPFFIGAWGTISVLAFGTNDAPALRMWRYCSRDDVPDVVRGDWFREVLRRDDRDESDGGGDIDRVYDVDRIDPSPWWCSVCYCYGYGQMARAWIFVRGVPDGFGKRVYMRQRCDVFESQEALAVYDGRREKETISKKTNRERVDRNAERLWKWWYFRVRHHEHALVFLRHHRRHVRHHLRRRYVFGAHQTKTLTGISRRMGWVSSD